MRTSVEKLTKDMSLLRVTNDELDHKYRYVLAQLDNLTKEKENIASLRDEKLSLEKNVAVLRHDLKESLRKLELEADNRKKSEQKASELWSKLEHDQNYRAQLSLNVQHANEQIAALEKQLASISEKFKNEYEGNMKLKKAHAELGLNSANKEKAVEELHVKVNYFQDLNSKHIKDISSLQAQLEKAQSSWAITSDKSQELESMFFILFRFKMS